MNINNKKKEVAIALRLKGKSIRDIEATLKINRSTLSGWLRDVPLTPKQKKTLYKNWLLALQTARLKAMAVHQRNRLERINKIKADVDSFLSDFKMTKELGQLMFAVFYLAEGTKTEGQMSFANSNPNLLKAILTLFRNVSIPDESKFRCCLHLRKDQTDEKLKTFWSKLLQIPKSQFIKSQFDERTKNKTYPDYKGVCIIYYYDTAAQRRTMYMGKTLVNQWLNGYNYPS